MNDQLPRILGPYRLEALLGAGGMGEVYRAFDLRLDRRVAIKHIRPDKSEQYGSRERLRREARAVARLNHPSIVQIFDILELLDGDWIVMEFVDGPNLARLLGGGPLDVPRALSLARDVAQGLVEAHEEELVHRDLKTENVVVTPKGRAKVLDFGLAKSSRRHEAESTLSVAGMVIGTCRAMSPEQARGLEVGPRSDLFSLGTMLYEMVTGRSPFLAATPPETLSRVLSHDPPPVRTLNPAVPEGLDALIAELLEKEPEKRTASAAKVDERLRRIADALGSSASRPEAAGVHPLSRAGTEPLPTETQAAFAFTAGARPPSSASSDQASGERRQITVLVCELNSVAGADPIDPEESLLLMPAFRQLAKRVVERFGGRAELEEVPGGLVAQFGYPLAHADDVDRALHAGLGVVRAFVAERGRLEGDRPNRLAVRIGIHTDMAVVAKLAGDHSLRLAMAEMPRYAARLCELAGPDRVLVSASTHLLVADRFRCERLARDLDGQGVFRVLEYEEKSQVLQGGIGPQIAKVVRAQEVRQLLDRWELAEEGAGQLVLLSGEAGIGKTRLVRTFKGHLAGASRTLIECHCSPHYRNTAFYPLSDFVRRMMVSEDESEPSDAPAAGPAADPSWDLPLASLAPRLADVLSVPGGPRETTVLTRSPEAQSARTLESVVALFLELAESRPVILVVENLEWIDPSTLELLRLLVDQVPTSRILILLSFRQDRFEPPWGARSYVTHITLGRLTRRQVEVLIEMLADGRPLSPAARAEIVARSDGNPAFVEELTRLFLAGGPLVPDFEADPTASQSAVVIPATLQGWLTARLDRLGKSKKLVQLAAVLGREFSYDLLCDIASLDETELQRQLDHLVDEELLHRRGAGNRATYTFRNAMMRDAAHESLLKSLRRRYHRHIARVLTEHHPDEAAPELLAYHYTEAGMIAEAVACWRQAAESAIRSSAYREALDHARRGLGLLTALPDKAARIEQDFALNVILGATLRAVKGFNAPQAEQAFARARELWGQVEKAPRLFPIVECLADFYLSRGQLVIAHAMSNDLLELAEKERDSDNLPDAHWIAGFVLLQMGRFEASRAHQEEGIAFYATRFSQEPKLSPGMGLAAASSLGDLSWALWFSGFPDQALECSRKSLETMEQFPDAFTRVFTLFRIAFLHAFRRESEKTREVAQSLIDFANQQGFLFYVGIGRFLLGHAHAAEGRYEEGIRMMSEGIDGVWATGMSAGRPRNLVLLAEACGRYGEIPQGLSLLREAFAAADASSDRHFEAEIHRVRGELLRLQGASADVIETCFHQARDTARLQGARSLELRAVMSLARLRRSQKRPRDARDVLREAYEAFTEGFDTVDLREAKAMLETLA